MAHDSTLHKELDALPAGSIQNEVSAHWKSRLAAIPVRDKIVLASRMSRRA